MEALARSKIEQSRLEELGNIETRRKENLAKLGIKFAIADQAKTSFGYIGITSLSLLFGVFIFNDMTKLIHSIYQCYLDYKVRKRVEIARKKRQKEKENEERNKNAQIKIEYEHSHNLKEKLEKFHLKLVKSVASHKKRNNQKIILKNPNNSHKFSEIN